MKKQRLSINTSTGWRAYAEKMNTKTFISEFGRQPRDYSEVTAWVNECVEAADALCDSETIEKHEAKLRTADGGRYWVTAL